MDDGSKGTLRMTVGVDLGDQYSYLDTESGEVLEESRVRTTPEAFERRFGCERLHIAIEVGTHSPWVSRLLEECGHTRSWWPTLASTKAHLGLQT